MHVAVLGGGLQGCCIALALAAKGAQVTLIDRNTALMSRAAVINEGKIHLGYMYGGDPSFSTASTMIAGALAFAPFLARQLELDTDRIPLSTPATYLVHRDSQRGAEELARYFRAVHELLSEAAEGRRSAYFGRELRPPRVLLRGELEALFDPAACLAAYETAERAINPLALAEVVRSRIEQDPAINVQLKRTVLRAGEGDGGIFVESEGPDGEDRHCFDHVVNALWDGRLAIDATLGIGPIRPWLHRFKNGVRFRAKPRQSFPSVTVVLGPFGEVVNYGDGTVFLTWYPACVIDRSDRLAPPAWPSHPAEPLRSEVISGTVAGLAEIVPALRNIGAEQLSEAIVAGGVIVAWGETDIDDRESELHQRFAIGVTSRGRYHSVDPGKLTMIPYFADICAKRITGA